MSTNTLSSADYSLQHVAIIPDGNRRWAQSRGMPVWDGVRNGVQTAERTFEVLRARGIPWCTFWASSYDNLTKRPLKERLVLNELFTDWFTRLIENPTIHAHKVRVRVLGEWPELLAPEAIAAIRAVVVRTEPYTGAALTFLIGYDGDHELTAAVQSLVETRSATLPQRTAVTLQDLRTHAWTNELPEVDVIIRTGSWEDPHRSANFLPLLTSNVHESYPRVYWPDFSEAELEEVLADVRARDRRLGG